MDERTSFLILSGAGVSDVIPILLEKSRALFGIAVESVVGVTALGDPASPSGSEQDAGNIDPKFAKGYI
ncbi:MAG TPA: hypothetical protein VMM54_03485 [Nitrospirota bacterium]|nr:hypothetical protein [Nitrospirota bacterium]